MTATIHPSINETSPVAPATRCPFHDGIATLDLFLAALDPRERELFDAALDLRSLFLSGVDATACAQQLFDVRTLLGSRHYLAFYRVRRFAHRSLCLEVRTDRTSPWWQTEFPLDGGRFDEVINTALARLADAQGEIPATAHVRFSFAQSN